MRNYLKKKRGVGEMRAFPSVNIFSSKLPVRECQERQTFGWSVRESEKERKKGQEEEWSKQRSLRYSPGKREKCNDLTIDLLEKHRTKRIPERYFMDHDGREKNPSERIAKKGGSRRLEKE